MAVAAPFIIAGMAVASGVVKAAGAAASANAASNAALQTAQANWQAVEEQAQTERELGRVAYQRGQRQGAILRGRSLAALSGAGVDPTEGSPLDLVAEQAAESEYAAEIARFQHLQRAWQFEKTGSLGITQANLQSEAYLTRGRSEAIGSIVSGVAQGASAILSFGAGGAASGAIPSPASQGISVGSVGGQPVGYYTGGAPSGVT